MPEITSPPDETGEEILNVSASVGQNGVNYAGDVLLVQAFFCEVLPYLYGVPETKVPYPSGTYDRNTAYLILFYQERSSLLRKVKVWRDGLINRAVGPTVPGKSRVWTITYLNEDMYYVHTARGYQGSYVNWLTTKYEALSYYAGNQVEPAY